LEKIPLQRNKKAKGKRPELLKKWKILWAEKRQKQDLP